MAECTFRPFPVQWYSNHLTFSCNDVGSLSLYRNHVTFKVFTYVEDLVLIQMCDARFAIGASLIFLLLHL